LKKLLLISGLLFASLLNCALAAYPERPITLVIPYPPGGPSDRMARVLIEAMKKPLGGVPIIIDNVGGAGGTVGHNKVAKASNDGYTILLSHIAMATAPALYPKLPYDALTDFEYLGLFGEVPMALVSRPDLPATSFVDLVRWIAKSPSAVNFANSGLGSASHLCGLLFQQRLMLKMTPIPYKGTGPAMVDLMGGQTDLMCDQVTSSGTQITAGKVKAFAVSSRSRIGTEELRHLPTLDELGMPGFNVAVWHGLYAPKGTPKAVLDRLNNALKDAVKSKTFVKQLEAAGGVPIADSRNNPVEHKRYFSSEVARWAVIIKAAEQYSH
jgi:tripartite-type tricarboxylate transporter receptor subunit TctC